MSREYEKGDKVRIHDGTETHEGLEGEVFKTLNDQHVQVDLGKECKLIFLEEHVEKIEE